MVGRKYEHGGIAKDGAKMVNAVANASVPKFTIIIGGSFGAGNYAMCGRGLDPRFIFSWPNSRTAVMGGAQAGKVLRIVTEEKHLKMGKEADPKMLDMIEQATAQKLDKGSTPLYGTARLWDDGIIDPRDTRNVLAYLLDICAEAEARPLNLLFVFYLGIIKEALAKENTGLFWHEDVTILRTVSLKCP